VAKVQTLLPPRSLVTILLSFEKSLRRVRTQRWGPRTIDLDVLFIDDLTTSFEEIVVPHPRMHRRMFVIKPLADVAPHFLHPVLGERVIHMLEKLKEQGEEEPPVFEESRLDQFRREGKK
jgi:dihydroneopterin aldolase/2-amino-4-hydroxy-6-hydroxymethyldihydropteridine diphosphokinase